jgi:hypothetical protein
VLTTTLRPWLPGDEVSLLECFEAAFRTPHGAPAPRRSRAEWAWAFLDNPAGRRVFLALAGERVVAQYAALPQRVWIGGEERVFAQVVDSMVHPEQRGGGLFVRTARAFFEEYGGRDRDLVHYGWPVGRALEIGQRALGYDVLRAQDLLAAELSPADAGPLPEGAALLADFDRQARWLYDRCCGDWGASGVRDAEYLEWRYARHPRHRYEALGVRDGEGQLRGLAVLRVADWIRPDLGLVVEWLVPPGEPEAGELLLAGARAHLARRGASALVALLPEWSAWFATFQEWGLRVHPSPYVTVARSFHPRYDTLWLRDHWWYQLGDSDLV